MSKQSNSKCTPSSTKAASGSGGSPASAQTIRKISGPSLKGSHVGPKNAPYLQK